MEVVCQQPADLAVLTSAVCGVLAVGLSLVPDWLCCFSRSLSRFLGATTAHNLTFICGCQ